MTLSGVGPGAVHWFTRHFQINKYTLNKSDQDYWWSHYYIIAFSFRNPGKFLDPPDSPYPAQVVYATDVPPLRIATMVWFPGSVLYVSRVLCWLYLQKISPVFLPPPKSTSKFKFNLASKAQTGASALGDWDWTITPHFSMKNKSHFTFFFTVQTFPLSSSLWSKDFPSLRERN